MQVLVLELKNIVDFCHAVIIEVASVACGAGSMKGLSVSPSVCPIDQQQQWCVAGLLLIAPRAGDVHRYQAPTVSSHSTAALCSAANAC